MSFLQRCGSLIYLALAAASGVFSAHAQDFNFQNPFPMINGAYVLDGVDTISKGNPAEYYRISSYLPPGTLIYFRDRKEYISVEGINYEHAITQHGQNVWVPQDAVSIYTFKDLYGDQDVVFHASSYMCPSDHKDCEITSGIEIVKGSILKKIEYGGDYIKVSKTEGKITSSGYISADDFSGRQSAGILSDASLAYPRFLHYRTREIKALSTDCGQQVKEINLTELSAELSVKVETPALLDIVKGAFSVGASKKNTQSAEGDYGGKYIATKYWVINVLEADDRGVIRPGVSKERDLFVSASIACAGVARSIEPVSINSILITEKRHSSVAIQFKDFYPTIEVSDEKLIPLDSPRYKVFQNNGSHLFLTSINVPSDYEAAIRRLASQTDLSIAEIILGQFNASCPAVKRNAQMLRKTCHDAMPMAP